MRRLLTAIRIFFYVLFRSEAARQVERILRGEPSGQEPGIAEAAPVEAPAPPAAGAAVRSEALTLLATLQREARFVDFIQESLSGYSDAQVGAAVRDVHRDCGRVLQRMFSLRPVFDQPEGADVEVPAGFDAACFRLTGNVTGQPPFRGRLVHPGWEATTCQLPEWSGTETATGVIAPAEVEVR